MIRRRLMQGGEEGMIQDKAFIGVYTLEEDITNDITLSSVLADYIGSGEIWIRKDIDGNITSELLAVIFSNDTNDTKPYWIRHSANDKIRCQNTNSVDYYLIASAGTQFYRFNGYGGLTQ